MQPAHLLVAFALVSCGGQIAGPSVQGGGATEPDSTDAAGSENDASASTGDDARAPACVHQGEGEWFCSGLGAELACPSVIVAGVTCLGDVVTSNPQMPAHLTSPGFSCLACTNGDGTVWTCGSSGWQSGTTLSCAR